MAMKLIYNVELQDAVGNSYFFTGAQAIATNAPAAGDLTGLATAMGADIAAQMTTGANGYLVQSATDGNNGDSAS